jgi:hypothetical protein
VDKSLKRLRGFSLPLRRLRGAFFEEKFPLDALPLRVGGDPAVVGRKLRGTIEPQPAETPR